MYKPPLMIFEGISGSGKTTLQKAVQKKLGYGYVSIDRFTPSVWVYSQLREEIDPIKTQHNIVSEAAIQENFKVFMIWTQASPIIAKERCELKGDWADADWDRLNKTNSLYHQYFTSISTYKNLIDVFTVEPIEDCVDKVIEGVFYGTSR